MNAVAISPAATRAASLPSLAAGLLWVAAWFHLLLAHGASQVNEQRSALGLTWLDSGRLIAPSLLLAATAVWLLVRESRHAGMRLAATVAIMGLLVAGAGAALGFWTQPVGTYVGASRETGAAAMGGLLAMLGSGVAAVGLVAIGVTAARVRLLPGWVAVLFPLAGLSSMPWLHESTWALGFGIAWMLVGGFLASDGRDDIARRGWPSRPRALPDRMRCAGMLAGAFAVASGIAYIAYLILDASVRDVAITAWNLLIIPAAVVLGLRFASGAHLIAAGATAAGVAASVLWAFDFRRAAVEPWWIALAAAWWLGLGLVMRPHHRMTARLTFVLGMAAVADLIVTLGDAPLPWLAIGGLKLPLTTLWSIWVGALLIREGSAHRGRSGTSRAAGAMAVVGGLVWAFGSTGWLLTHGTQPDPSSAQLFGLRGTEYTQLLAVGAFLWAVGALAAALEPAMGRVQRAAAALALLGAAMVSVGAILETSVVDPDRDFLHPAVQGGWLLFIGGLFPVMSLGMLGLAAAARQSRVLRCAYALAGVLTPLPVLAFMIGGLAAGGAGWVVVLAALHAAPGLGWMAVGRARLSSESGADGEAATDEEVRAVVSDGRPPRQGVDELMPRSTKDAIVEGTAMPGAGER